MAPSYRSRILCTFSPTFRVAKKFDAIVENVLGDSPSKAQLTRLVNAIDALMAEGFLWHALDRGEWRYGIASYRRTEDGLIDVPTMTLSEKIKDYFRHGGSVTDVKRLSELLVYTYGGSSTDMYSILLSETPRLLREKVIGILDGQYWPFNNYVEQLRLEESE